MEMCATRAHILDNNLLTGCTFERMLRALAPCRFVMARFYSVCFKGDSLRANPGEGGGKM